MIPPAKRSGTGRHDEFIAAADGREVRVTCWPAHGVRRAIVLFSHGAKSAPDTYLAVIHAWNAAGFEVRAPLHVDSLEHPRAAEYAADVWRARLEDMQLLAATTETPTYIAAGHSYGALVALTLGGVQAKVPPGFTAPLGDVRTAAVVALSPPGAIAGFVTGDGYAALRTPAFIQTGTRDIVPGWEDRPWDAHLDAYEAAPPGDKYALILDGVDHYFGGAICRHDLPGPAQHVELTWMVTLTTSFMQAFGAHDADARERLTAALKDVGPCRLLGK